MLEVNNPTYYIKNFGESIEDLYEFFDRILSPFFQDFGSAYTIISVWDYEQSRAFIDKNKLSPFCSYINESLEKKSICLRCDKRIMDKLSRTKKPAIYWCYWGMRNIAIPIIIKDIMVGAILFGEKRISNSEEDFKGIQKMEKTAERIKLTESELNILHLKRQESNAITFNDLRKFKRMIWTTSQYTFPALFDYLENSRAHNRYLENILNVISKKLNKMVHNEICDDFINNPQNFWIEYKKIIELIKSGTDCREMIVLLTENKQTRIVSSRQGLPENIPTITESELITAQLDPYEPIKHLLVVEGKSNVNCLISQQILKQYPKINVIMYKKSYIGFNQLDKILHFIIYFDSSKPFKHKLRIWERQQVFLQLICDTVNVYKSLEETRNLKTFVREKEQFLNDIVHEVGQPLHGIVAYSDSLTSSYINLDRKDLYSVYIRNIARMIFVIIRGLEYIARGDISVKKEREEISIRRTLIEFAQIMQGYADAGNVKIHVTDNHTMKKIGKIKVDKGYLEIAMINILFNAIKYSFPCTKITITALRDRINNRVYIYTKNFGIRIPKDMMKERIFEQGIRVPEAQEYCSSGLGIGLYITREIMNAIGGSVYVAKSVPTKQWYQKYPIYRNDIALCIPFSNQRRRD